MVLEEFDELYTLYKEAIELCDNDDILADLSYKYSVSCSQITSVAIYSFCFLLLLNMSVAAAPTNPPAVIPMAVP